MDDLLNLIDEGIKFADERAVTHRMTEDGIQYLRIRGLLQQFRIQQRLDTGGWMPIETAPRDGSMILVCLPRQGRLILRARFDPIHKHWLYDYRGEGGISNSTYFHNGDLWQPLPALPKEK